MSDSDTEVRTDGSSIVSPDTEIPTWRQRKEYTQGLVRLTYEPLRSYDEDRY